MTAVLENSGSASGVSARSLVEGDRLIVDRMIAGDDQALAATYDAHGGYVYGLARRVTGDDQTAEDITQDVFVRLWGRPDLVDLGRGSLRTFLGTMCHHRAVDYVRTNRS
jgi:DNA-directed RNA polymerase specialized sigma24 family protein